MFGAINDQKDVADVMLMDLNDCLKKQWEMHVQSSSEKFRNDEFQKEATAQKGSLEALRDINTHIFNVEERYSNDSALVKQWITSDQEEEEQRKKKKLQSSEHENNNSSVEQQQQQEENILQLIRQRLDDNSKYDILEYIPTYSRWSVFEQEGTYRKYLQAIKYPFLSRTMALPHHLEYHLDIPFITFHKMRLISKTFNTRMMNRILRTTELTLFSLDDHTLPYFATFLRMQRLFKENNNRLTSDSIYLYEDRQHLCLVSNERASLAAFGISTSQPCAVLQLTNPSLWLMSSSSPSVTTTSVSQYVSTNNTLQLFNMDVTICKIEDVATIHNGDIDQEAKPLQTSKPFMFSFSDPTPNIFGATPSTTDNFSFASTVVSKKDKDDMNEQQSLIPLHETLEFQTSDDSEVVNSIPTTSTAISSDDQGLNPPMGTSLFNTSSSNTGFSSKSTTPEAHPFKDRMKAKYEIKARSGFSFLSEIPALPFVPYVEESKACSLDTSIEEAVCTLFIGNNTTLQSLIVFTPSRDTFSLSRILRVLTVLDHVLILTANGGTVVFTNESVKNVVLINSTTNESLLNDLPNVEKVLCYGCSSGSFGAISSDNIRKKMESKDVGDLVELFLKLDSRITMKLMDKITKIHSQGFAFGSKQLLLRDIIQQSSENDLEKAKSFISYLIKDLKYPCQDLNLFDASFHSLTDQCIAQYVVYLCNEYQGGRLMKIPEDDKGCEEILLALLSYGWNCWNQKDELIYMMCSWITKKHSILEFMLVNFYNTLDTDGLYSLMVHCCRQVRTRALDAILSYSLLHKEELLMNALIMPVKCAKSRSSFSTTIAQGETFTTSLLGVLFQHGAHACSGFLLQRTVERMSHEKFDSLGVNENGDNILHIFATSVRSTNMNGDLLLTLIRKARRLLYAENLKKQSPLWLLQLPDSYLVHCMEQELGMKLGIGPLKFLIATQEDSQKSSKN